MAQLNDWNERRRLKHINWEGTRKVYESTPISFGEIARQLRCSKNLVVRRCYRESWRKRPGVRHDMRTTDASMNAMNLRHANEDMIAAFKDAADAFR